MVLTRLYDNLKRQIRHILPHEHAYRVRNLT